jgi:ABC-type branched-subunit amino acid transport system substrate-binding protein
VASVPAAAAPTTSAPAGGNGGATDVGVTASTITLGTVATLSGPVPGLFQGAVTGVQAWAAYQNSLGGIFGRTMRIDVRDDQFDAGQFRAGVQDLSTKAFAFVSNFSLYDDAGVAQITQSKVPDLGVAINATRNASPFNFSPNPVQPGGPLGPFHWIKQHYPDGISAVGTLYPDIPSSKAVYDGYRAAAESVGFRFAYARGYQATETDFTADVVRMKSSGVKVVDMLAADVKTVARLAKSMQQQGFEPQAFIVHSVAYDPSFLALAGGAAEGVVNIQTQAMYLGEDTSIPEVRLFLHWFHQVKPGAQPDLFAVYGWVSGRLFARALQAAGPKATRAGVLEALHHIDDFDGNGMVIPAGPASKRPGTCYLVVTVKGGRYVRTDPASGFRCGDGYLRR